MYQIIRKNVHWFKTYNQTLNVNIRKTILAVNFTDQR